MIYKILHKKLKIEQHELHQIKREFTVVICIYYHYLLLKAKRNQRNQNEIDWYEENGRKKIKDKTK
jgi:hypothetical protein